MTHNFANKSSEYDSSGPRPPIPGQEEANKYKMTDSAQSEFHYFNSSSSSSRSSSSPSWRRWAHNLGTLLEDREGVELFKKFVESEGGEASDRLNFYFACEGLKQQSDPEKVRQIIGAIYRFLKKSSLTVPESIRHDIKNGLKNKAHVLTPDLFDQMQQDVEFKISETTYPHFLQSDIYLQYVQVAMDRGQIPEVSTSAGPSTSNALNFLSRSSTLPTLHEESDATNIDGADAGAMGGFPDPSNRVPILSGSSSSSKPPLSLTKDALIATQKKRLNLRSPGTHGFSAYTNYAPYNPVSRRDSEQASLSSGRADSDTMSISSMSVEGRNQRRHNHHQYSLERRMIRDSSSVNQEIQPIIPRPARPPTVPHSTENFLLEVAFRLEAVKKEQDSEDEFKRKFDLVDPTKHAREFVEDVASKLVLNDGKDAQDILDEHVSRVLSSPGNVSPGYQFQRPRTTNDMLFAAGPQATASMRHHQGSSRAAPPESNMRKFSKWGSINTDSGISLVSNDTMKWPRDAMSTSGSSSSSMRVQRGSVAASSIPELVPQAASNATQHFVDPRRSKRYPQQPPLPQKNIVPPPLPAKSSSQPAFNPAQAVPTATEYTSVVCTYHDETVPYRLKIYGRQPITLKQVRDVIPRKGNYRFFFKTFDDESKEPVFEEISSDFDVLPLFEGKIMASLKPLN